MYRIMKEISFKKNNKKGGFLEQSEISHMSQPS